MALSHDGYIGDGQLEGPHTLLLCNQACKKDTFRSAVFDLGFMQLEIDEQPLAGRHKTLQCACAQQQSCRRNTGMHATHSTTGKSYWRTQAKGTGDVTTSEKRGEKEGWNIYKQEGRG